MYLFINIYINIHVDSYISIYSYFNINIDNSVGRSSSQLQLMWLFLFIEVRDCSSLSTYQTRSLNLWDSNASRQGYQKIVHGWERPKWFWKNWSEYHFLSTFIKWHHLHTHFTQKWKVRNLDYSCFLTGSNIYINMLRFVFPWTIILYNYCYLDLRIRQWIFMYF